MELILLILSISLSLVAVVLSVLGWNDIRSAFTLIEKNKRESGSCSGDCKCKTSGSDSLLHS